MNKHEAIISLNAASNVLRDHGFYRLSEELKVIAENHERHYEALEQVLKLSSPKHFSEGRLWEIADKALRPPADA